MTRRPLISLITATYNSLPFIDRLYASLQAQTYGGFEWICIDDCSRDGTVEHLEGLPAPGDAGMQLYRLPHNTGGGIAWAVGVEKARGDIITMVDHDDELTPHALQRIVDAWPMVADDPEVSALMFRIADPATGQIIGRELPAGKRITISWLINRRPDVHDATFVFKADVKKRFATVEAMEDLALGGWLLSKISRASPFVVAPPEPIRAYHRDNPESQTNSIKISRKTVATYAGMLDEWDRWYWLRPVRWLKHAVTLLRFSRDVHGTMWMGVRLTRRPLLKLLLVCLMPVASILRAMRDPLQVLKFQRFVPGSELLVRDDAEAASGRPSTG